MFFHFIGHHLWLFAAGSGAGVAARYIQLRHRRPINFHFADKESSRELLRLQELYGYNAHSLVSISSNTRSWSCKEVEGATGYSEFGKVWLVPGDPLASAENLHELSRRFLETAYKEKRVVGFMPATERFALEGARLGLRAVKVGAAPYFDLETWAPRGDRAKKARAGVNQARRAGVCVSRVEVVDETLIKEAGLLCKSWLRTRRSAVRFGWLFAVDLFQNPERKRFFTARDATGKLVGFLAASPIPAREGWYLEDVLRLPDGPNGTSDLLVVKTLEYLKRDGAKLATLGTAPLARDGIVDPDVGNNAFLASAVRIVTNCFAVFYNFEGLRRFKAKFAPSWWESEYLLFSRSTTTPPRLIYALIQAIVPTGASSLVAQHVSRALRRTAWFPDSMLAHSRSKKSLAVSEVQLGADSSPMNEDQLESAPVATRSGVEAAPAQDSSGLFVSVNGIKLHYLSAGSGRPVVFIHGNPGSHQDYSMVVLGQAARSYKTFAFDRPGHGYSGRHDRIETTVEVQARLLRDALRNLSIDKPVLVGHSWGGALALAAAVEYANDWSGLVLLAPAAYPSASVEWWSLLPHIPFLGNLFVNTLTPLIGRGIIKESLKKAYHPQDVQEDYLQLVAAMWTRPEQVKAYAYDERTLNSSLKKLSQRYAEIRMPVVIVTGDSDILLKPNEHACRLHRAIPGSHLIVLPGTGHQIPQTRPESVLEAIGIAWRLINQSTI